MPTTIPYDIPDNFPFYPIAWDKVAADFTPSSEGVEFPGQPVAEWMARIRLYHRLFEGDFSLVLEDARLQQNFFKVIAERIAEELMSVPPTTGDPLADESVGDVAYDAIVDMCRYGSAVLWTPPRFEEGEDDPYPVLLDRLHWVPTETGWMYAVPMANTVDGIYDTIEVLAQQGDTLFGGVYHYTDGFPGFIGELVRDYEPFQMTYEDTVAISPLNPLRRDSEQGTSMFDAMGPAVIETARRYSTNSAVLDKFRNPLFAARGHKQDILGLTPGLEADGAGSPPDLSAQPLTYAEEQAKLNEELDSTGTDFEKSDIVFLPPAIQDLEPITWDAYLSESFTQIDEMRRMIRAISTVPGLFPGEEEAATSGVALRLLNRPFFSKSGAMQKRFIRAYRESSGIELEWDHPYSESDQDDIPDPSVLATPQVEVVMEETSDE